MKFKSLLLKFFFFTHLASMSFAQLPEHRGMYVDGFVSQILGNKQQTDKLLDFIESNHFNALTLYELHLIDFENVRQVRELSRFIRNARKIGVKSIGAAAENTDFFLNKIIPYNQSQVSRARFDVLNFEFEFWVPELYQNGKYYCQSYLQPNGFSCDQKGAFQFYLQEIQNIHQLSQNNGLITEAYLGWFSQEQADSLLPYIDRLLLHAYVQNQEFAFEYSKERLLLLENTDDPIEVIGLFSSEDQYLKQWLNDNDNDLLYAYSIYHNDLINFRNWNKVYENGYHWFTYSVLPEDAKVIDTNDETIDLEATFAANISIGPNPADDFVQLKGDLVWVKKVLIYDLNGELIKNFNFSSKIFVKELKKGIYLFRLIGENQVQTFRLLKH